MIHHITYQLREDEIGSPELAEFMSLLDLIEIEPQESVPEGWRVRWFADRGYPAIHFVSVPFLSSRWLAPAGWGLGHFCVDLPAEGIERARASGWCVRDSGSGRIWLQWGPVRVEVRSS
jgi:hypothetical protein